MAGVDPLVSVSLEPSRPGAASAAVLRWAGVALVAAVWISAVLFGLYILAFYAGALAGATGLLLLGTYYFTKLFWGPAILQWLAG